MTRGVPLATKEHFIGRAGYRELARRWIAGFPDGRVAIVAVHVHGETAATELHARGTHTGVLELPGFPPIVELTMRAGRIAPRT